MQIRTALVRRAQLRGRRQRAKALLVLLVMVPVELAVLALRRIPASSMVTQLQARQEAALRIVWAQAACLQQEFPVQ